MDIILLRSLSGQHESLRETTHRLSSVGQLAGHLDNDSAAERCLRVDLGDLGVAVPKVQLLDLHMDGLLTDSRGWFPVGRV